MKDRSGTLSAFDREVAREFGGFPCGVDEVGRGCLAGPVVAAAVLLRPNVVLPGLDDSKRLAADERERQVIAIRERAVAVGVGFVGPRWIERRDIRRASLRAMARAVRAVNRVAACPVVLVDGRDTIPELGLPQRAIVAGDGTSLAVAAASVVAKVVRDRFMRRLAVEHPVYGFERHVGYGTSEHLDMLRLHGPCIAHRRTFQPVFRLELPFEASLPES